MHGPLTAEFASDRTAGAFVTHKYSRFFAGRNIVKRIDLLLAVVIPEFPIISPLVPADAEVLHVDVVFEEHLADLSPGHAGNGVTVHDDVFARIFCLCILESADDAIDR